MLTSYLENLIGHLAVAEKSHHAFDTLISSLLVVIFGALNGVKKPVTVIRDSLQHIVDPNEQRERAEQDIMLQEFNLKKKEDKRPKEFHSRN